MLLKHHPIDATYLTKLKQVQGIGVLVKVEWLPWKALKIVPSLVYHTFETELEASKVSFWLKSRTSLKILFIFQWSISFIILFLLVQSYI